ncbi:hypothetical protein CAL27_00650 [Bordetella genomosp. 1]|uniref:Secreted protein n=1 Tax=Bordetella genomosp. 1 TaxID=1395607 RepID=A0ABX4F2N4_9BORD|nr:hypothetical protein CAL27_00650 [Bordetella genomosp. 1]
MSIRVALVIAMLRQLLADTLLTLLGCPRHSPTTTHPNRTDRFGSSASSERTSKLTEISVQHRYSIRPISL